MTWLQGLVYYNLSRKGETVGGGNTKFGWRVKFIISILFSKENIDFSTIELQDNH